MSESTKPPQQPDGTPGGTAGGTAGAATPAAGPGTQAAAPRLPKEIGGAPGPEPTRYGDWQHKGRVTDF